MLLRWKLRFFFIVLWVFCGVYLTDSIQSPNPNYVAPLAPSIGRPGTIMPFSLYKQKLEKEKELKGLDNSYADEKTPIKVYLPAYKNANESQISKHNAAEVMDKKRKLNEMDPKIQAELIMREKMRARLRGPLRPQLPQPSIVDPVSHHQSITDRKPLPNNDKNSLAESMFTTNLWNRFVEQPAIITTTTPDQSPIMPSAFGGEKTAPIQSAKTYSTGASREQLTASELHKSVFKPKSLPQTPGYRPSYQRPNPNPNVSNGKSTLLSLPPDRPHSHNQVTEKEGFSFSEYFKNSVGKSHLTAPRLTNGVPLEPNINPIIPANYHGQAAVPFSPQYTPIQPIQASTNNIFENLLASTGLRQPPANLGLGQAGASAPNLNPLQQLLGGGSPLEHMAKLAKNLLTTQEGNQIINRLGNLLDTKNGSPLTSNVLNSIIKPASEMAAKGTAEQAVSETAEKTISEVLKAGAGKAVEDIVKPGVAVASGASEAIASASKDDETIEKKMSKLMEVLPSDQRELLEKALKEGEITLDQVSPTLSSMVEQHRKSNFSLIQAESKLMEWIQENRPRASVKEIRDSKSAIGPEKLPYYGKYCGSFVENRDSTKKFGVNGAVWAVDDRRLMVSKFFFQPGSSMENITFWAGPSKIKGNPTIDIFPSEDGFYIRPEPVNIRAFIPDKIEVVKAKVRGLSEEIQKIVRSVNLTNSSDIAENDENKDEPALKIEQNELRRMKRDIFREVYEHQTINFPVKIKPVEEKTDLKLHIKGSSQDSTVVNMFKHDLINTTTALSATSLSTSSPSTSTTPISTSTLISLPPTSSTPSSTSLDATNSISTTLSLSVDENDSKTTTKMLSTYPLPLEWSAGFQPLLLTFPEDKWVKNIHWLSLYDHKRKETIAFVLMPNGAAFQIPYIVQLRPLARNPPYMAYSGPIQIADTKTIIIHEFTLKADGLPVWFTIGKEIIPNSDGHIVPVYDKKTGTFDCDSLRDYNNETVVLKLPGTLDIKDVYYFAVFSIPKAVSLTSIHVPYLDLQVPPNLEGISTPKCIFEK